MKKYLLFSFGQFNDKSVKTILNIVSRFSDNDKLLFQNGSEYLNVQFFSNDSLDNLRDKISKGIDGMTNCQFLFEDDKYYDNLIKNLKKVFGLENQEQSLTSYIIKESIKDDLEKLEKSFKEIEWDDSLFDEIESNSDVKIEEEKEDFEFIQKLDLVIKDFINDNKTEVNNVEDFECGDDEDLYIAKTLKKEYTIDDILDKINEKGLSSLDKEELNFLNNLSK